MTAKIVKFKAEWRKQLSDEQYEATRRKYSRGAHPCYNPRP